MCICNIQVVYVRCCINELLAKTTQALTNSTNDTTHLQTKKQVSRAPPLFPCTSAVKWYEYT